MTADLTERYVAAVARTLPERVQGDVRNELLASINDAIDARVEQGDQHEVAEFDVITELGDPDALAASYADRPLYLIGPKYYLQWWRLLKLLWIIVPLSAFFGVTLAKLIEDAPVADVISAALAAGFAAIVYVGFWVTVVFVILERAGANTDVTWTPHNLPEPQETGASRSDLIASLVFPGLVGAALLWDRFVGLVFVADGSVDVSIGLGGQTHVLSVLNPELGAWWLGGMLALIVAEAGVAIAVYASRGWTTALAELNTILSAAIAALLLVPLVRGELFSPELLDLALNRGNVPVDALATLIAVAVIVSTVWTSVAGARKARRAR